MPLDLAGLKEELETVFADPPATHVAAGQAWGNAVGAYAAAIVPASTAVSAAAATLGTALGSAFALSDAIPSMETAFAAFATAVGAGMAGYTPTPPAAPVGFAAQFAGPDPDTHAEAADQIGQLIHDWLTTGTSTLATPPNTVVPWS